MDETPAGFIVPDGAQARLNKAVKTLERDCEHVIDGLPGAYDAHRVPYTTIAFGKDIWGLESQRSPEDFKNITDEDCDQLIAAFVEGFDALGSKGEGGYTGNMKFRRVVWRLRPRFGFDLGEDGNARLHITSRLHF